MHRKKTIEKKWKMVEGRLSGTRFIVEATAASPSLRHNRTINIIRLDEFDEWIDTPPAFIVRSIPSTSCTGAGTNECQTKNDRNRIAETWQSFVSVISF